LLSTTYKKLLKIVLKRFGRLGIKWEFCTPKRRERSCSEEENVSYENKFQKYFQKHLEVKNKATNFALPNNGKRLNRKRFTTIFEIMY
jgi:hypothetical protein